MAKNTHQYPWTTPGGLKSPGSGRFIPKGGPALPNPGATPYTPTGGDGESLAAAFGTRGLAGGKKDWLKELKKMLNSKEAKGAGALILASLLMSKGRQQIDEFGQQNLQMEQVESAQRMATPDHYYVEAALGQAREQENQAQAAVMGRLAGGGVLGPSLAQGEYSIGG